VGVDTTTPLTGESRREAAWWGWIQQSINPHPTLPKIKDFDPPVRRVEQNFPHGGKKRKRAF